MKTKHSKGNWTVSSKVGGTVVTDNESGISTNTKRKFNSYIRKHIEYYGGICICESIHSKADAKLIAAAPDLLDALQTMMIGLGESEIPNDGHSTLSTGYTMDILIAAKNAINKATL